MHPNKNNYTTVTCRLQNVLGLWPKLLWLHQSTVDHTHTIVYKTVHFRRWIVWYLYAENADNTLYTHFNSDRLTVYCISAFLCSPLYLYWWASY